MTAIITVDPGNPVFEDIEKGSSISSFELAMKLLCTYSVNMVEFLTETGYLAPEIKRSGETKQVPLLSWTQAGAWMEIASTKEGQYEQVVETDSSGTFALKVKGNSIEPEFFDGDILIINNTLFHPNPDYRDLLNGSDVLFLNLIRHIKFWSDSVCLSELRIGFLKDKQGYIFFFNIS